MKKLFLAFVVSSLVLAGALYWVIQSGSRVEKDSKKPVAVHERAREEESRRKSIESVVSAEKYKLRVVTQPVEAEVYLDNFFMGRSPVEVELTSKRQELHLMATGFEEYLRMTPQLSEVEGDVVWRIRMKSLDGNRAPEVEKRSEKDSDETVLAKVKTSEISDSPRAIERSSERSVEQSKVIEEESLKNEAIKEELIEENSPDDLLQSQSDAVESSELEGVDLLNQKEVRELAIEKFLRKGTRNGYFIQLQSIPESEFLSQAEKQIQFFQSISVQSFGCRVKVRGRQEPYIRILIGPYARKSVVQLQVKRMKESLPPDAFIAKSQKCL